MRNYFKWGFFKAFGIIAITAIFIFAGCDNATGGGDDPGGDSPPAGTPPISGTVTILGTARVGETLTANIAALAGSGTVSYTWKQDNGGNGTFATISGGTAATYPLTLANLDNKIKVTVTRSNYTGSLPSDPTAAVTMPLPLDTIAEVEAAIEASLQGGTASYPIPVTMTSAFDLGNMTDPGSNWQLLLGVLETEGKFVALDLSACTINGGMGTAFASYKAAATGEDKVVSLVLPDTARTIPDGTNINPTFKHFTALKTVSGAEITAVSQYAFLQCSALTSVNLPAAISIGQYAFMNCPALTSVNFPVVETIGYYALAYCPLTSVSFPKAISIGEHAFSDSTTLTSVSFPEVITIGNYAFADSTALTSVSIPAAGTVTGPNSFRGVGSDASVAVFTIIIKLNCAFNDSNLFGFKTVYDGNIIGGAKAGGTYTYTKSNTTWTYTP